MSRKTPNFAYCTWKFDNFKGFQDHFFYFLNTSYLLESLTVV